jgi:hypothetical protein
MVLEAFFIQETRKPGEIVNTTDFATERPPERGCLELANFQLSTEH